MKKFGWLIFPASIATCLIVFIFTSIVLFGAFDVTRGLFDFSTIPQQEARQIVTSQSFELIWEKSIISNPRFVDNGKPDVKKVFLLAEDDQVIMLDMGNPIPSDTTLSSFDIETGQVIWETPYNNRLGHVGRNSENIYLISENSGTTPPKEILELCDPSLPICRSIKIRAIDISSGEESWSANYPNMFHVERFTVDDEMINIKGSSGYSSYVPEFTITSNNGERLTEFQGVTSFEEDESNENMIANLGFGEVISNYADNGEYIFFLTNNENSLLAVNKKNREIAGQVQFSGEPFETLYENRLRGFVVKENGNKIAVYLGDSGQLFVFDFIPTD